MRRASFLVPTPFLGLPVGQPKDAGHNVRRVMLDRWLNDDLTELGAKDLVLGMRIAFGALKERDLDFSVSFSLPIFYGPEKIWIFFLPVVERLLVNLKDFRDLLIGKPLLEEPFDKA